MIEKRTESASSKCVCPECKNSIDLSRYPNVATGMVIECNHCGMTLLVKDTAGGDVKTEIVDEGK
jgi:DNA-directed RNA polymerase subunit RPC12/RpoP